MEQFTGSYSPSFFDQCFREWIIEMWFFIDNWCPSTLEVVFLVPDQNTGMTPRTTTPA